LCDRHQHIDVRQLVPVHADFNLDLYRLGAGPMLARLTDQLVPDDRGRLLTVRRDPQ
jgi:hypothetical protein